MSVYPVRDKGEGKRIGLVDRRGRDDGEDELDRQGTKRRGHRWVARLRGALSLRMAGVGAAGECMV